MSTAARLCLLCLVLALGLAAVPAWAQSALQAPAQGERALSDCMSARWTVSSTSLFQVSFVNSGTSLGMTSLGPELPAQREISLGFWACKLKATLTYKDGGGSSPNQVLINAVVTSMGQDTIFNGVLAAWTEP